jgi:2-C-methyl-D-erythritol 4-phosphate cytidylyltransferase
MPTASVILPAAGRGKRFVGADTAPRRASAEPAVTKVFAPLAGRPVLAHTLDAFLAVEAVVEILVPVPADALVWARDIFADAAPGKRLLFLEGGEERTDSVARALEASEGKTELVLIHDAVRPLVRRAVIEEALQTALDHGAAVVGRPVDHTLKRVADGGVVAGTVSREHLWLAQTPQAFRREVIARAYSQRGRVVGKVTDDAQLVEAVGGQVVMVRGDAANVKITTAEDLRVCEALLTGGWPFED